MRNYEMDVIFYIHFALSHFDRTQKSKIMIFNVQRKDFILRKITWTKPFRLFLKWPTEVRDYDVYDFPFLKSWFKLKLSRKIIEHSKIMTQCWLVISLVHVPTMWAYIIMYCYLLMYNEIKRIIPIGLIWLTLIVCR